LIRLLAGLLVPTIAFVAFLRTLGNATEALAIIEAIPELWVLAYAVWRRRIEPVGATALAGFGIAHVLTIALGGSSLPLELHRALFPGAVVLAFLISSGRAATVAGDRKGKLAKERPEVTVQARSQLDALYAHNALAVLTAIIGLTMSADVAAPITLACTVSGDLWCRRPHRCFGHHRCLPGRLCPIPALDRLAQPRPHDRRALEFG
jgi:hypothetical protein